jgi:hypothetical protein
MASSFVSKGRSLPRARKTGNKPAYSTIKLPGTSPRYHPTTADQDYTPDEELYLRAIDDVKRTTGRQFLTNIELIRLAKQIGYVAPAVPRVLHPEAADVVAGPVPLSAYMKRRANAQRAGQAEDSLLSS